MLYIRRGDSDVTSVQGDMTAYYEQHSSLGLDLLTQSFSFLNGREIVYLGYFRLPETFRAWLWRHNEPGGVSNHQPHNWLLNRLFANRSKKTSKLRVTGLCVGNSPETGEFPAQMASNAEKVSIWWRHHEFVGMSYGRPCWTLDCHVG